MTDKTFLDSRTEIDRQMRQGLGGAPTGALDLYTEALLRMLVQRKGARVVAHRLYQIADELAVTFHMDITLPPARAGTREAGAGDVDSGHEGRNDAGKGKRLRRASAWFAVDFDSLTERANALAWKLVFAGAVAGAVVGVLVRGVAS